MKSTVQNILVFDQETTGLKASEHAVIEIACCPFDANLKDLPEYDSGIISIYDNRAITEGALKANGITRDQIANGRDPQVVVEELCKYFTGLKVGSVKPVLVGHNIDNFDIPFLVDFFQVFGKDLSKFVNTDFTIDTMWWARLKADEQLNYKLGTCCEIEGVELFNAHRAVADTRANKELVKKYIRNLRANTANTAQVVVPEEKVKRHRETFQF